MTGGRGRPSRLTAEAESRIAEALLDPPRDWGFDLEEWSLASVAALIERETGVAYHRRHVGRLMRRIGWPLPPVGPTVKVAFHQTTIRDPEGNPLHFRRRPRT